MEKINRRALRMLPYTMMSLVFGTVLGDLCVSGVTDEELLNMTLIDIPLIITSVNLVVSVFSASFLFFCQFGIRSMNRWMNRAFGFGIASGVMNVTFSVIYTVLFIRTVAEMRGFVDLTDLSFGALEVGNLLLGISMLLTFQGFREVLREGMSRREALFFSLGSWAIIAFMILWRAYRLYSAIRYSEYSDPLMMYLVDYNLIETTVPQILSFFMLQYAVVKYQRMENPSARRGWPWKRIREAKAEGRGV